MRILIVSAIGGHLREVMNLTPALEGHELGLVLNDRILPPAGFVGRTWYTPHWEREIAFIGYFLLAFRIVAEFRPKLLISAGAGHAVPFSLVAKLFGCQVVFLETMTSVCRPSLTGRIMYRIADLFMYQWEELGEYFPAGTCVGPVW